MLKPLGQTINDIPEHRLGTPSVRACAEAGMLAGLVTRLTAQPKTLALLNDAMLFLQAAETGCHLLTGNARDFDWFDQVLPGTWRAVLPLTRISLRSPPGDPPESDAGAGPAF